MAKMRKEEMNSLGEVMIWAFGVDTETEMVDGVVFNPIGKTELPGPSSE